MEQGYNSSYRIATYNLNEEIKAAITDGFQGLDIPKETFSIQSLETLTDENSNNLMNKPDVLLIGKEEELTEDMRKYCVQNFVQIIRVTKNSLGEELSSPMLTISIKKEPAVKKTRTSNTPIVTSELQEGIQLVQKTAQVTNMSKLKYLSNKVLKEQQAEVLPLENKDAVLGSLMRLNEFIRLKDGYTKMHSDHVSEYAVLLGKEVGLSEEDLELIRVGGELHDIGKVGIPDAILRKTSGLTEEEFQIMKRHTVIGDAILPNQGYQQIKEMIRYHHEKMDGKGYPDGLKGDAIPYFARILSVADTFDAMTTQRSYNRKKTLEEAFAELRRSSIPAPNRYGEMSQQLDPILVEYFIRGILKNEKLMEEFNQRDTEILQAREMEQLGMGERKAV